MNVWSDTHAQHVQLSSDPGSFLCGYTTALSLKCAHDTSQDTGVERGAKQPIPVVFFHVSCYWLLSGCTLTTNLYDAQVPFPRDVKPDTPYSLEELTHIVRALCILTARQALADKSRRPEQGD